MIAVTVADVKTFMNRLFLSEQFDAFQVSEASFTTFNTFHIDGTLQHNYYSQEEREESGLDDTAYSTWQQLRPFCLSLIKGTHTPLEFHIVFRLSKSGVASFLEKNGMTSMSPADISGMFLNLRYRGGTLTCTTGTALTLFSMDKTLDHAWDDFIKKWLSPFC